VISLVKELETSGEKQRIRQQQTVWMERCSKANVPEWVVLQFPSLWPRGKKKRGRKVRMARRPSAGIFLPISSSMDIRWGI